eukprot:gene371-2416_t
MADICLLLAFSPDDDCMGHAESQAPSAHLSGQPAVPAEEDMVLGEDPLAVDLLAHSGGSGKSSGTSQLLPTPILPPPSPSFGLDHLVNAPPIQSVVLSPLESRQIQLHLTPLKPGQMTVHGLRWQVCGVWQQVLFTSTGDPSASSPAEQAMLGQLGTVPWEGPGLEGLKPHEVTTNQVSSAESVSASSTGHVVSCGVDPESPSVSLGSSGSQLTVHVHPPAPQLQASIGMYPYCAGNEEPGHIVKSQNVHRMPLGQIVDFDLSLMNSGHAPISHMKLICTHSHLIKWTDAKEGPVTTLKMPLPNCDALQYATLDLSRPILDMPDVDTPPGKSLVAGGRLWASVPGHHWVHVLVAYLSSTTQEWRFLHTVIEAQVIKGPKLNLFVLPFSSLLSTPSGCNAENPACLSQFLLGVRVDNEVEGAPISATANTVVIQRSCSVSPCWALQPLALGAPPALVSGHPDTPCANSSSIPANQAVMFWFLLSPAQSVDNSLSVHAIASGQGELQAYSPCLLEGLMETFRNIPRAHCTPTYNPSFHDLSHPLTLVVEWTQAHSLSGSNPQTHGLSPVCTINPLQAVAGFKGPGHRSSHVPLADAPVFQLSNTFLSYVSSRHPSHLMDRSSLWMPFNNLSSATLAHRTSPVAVVHAVLQFESPVHVDLSAELLPYTPTLVLVLSNHGTTDALVTVTLQPPGLPSPNPLNADLKQVASQLLWANKTISLISVPAGGVKAYPLSPCLYSYGVYDLSSIVASLSDGSTVPISLSGSDSWSPIWLEVLPEESAPPVEQ